VDHLRCLIEFILQLFNDVFQLLKLSLHSIELDEKITVDGEENPQERVLRR
jgi:hypothetical protein